MDPHHLLAYQLARSCNCASPSKRLTLFSASFVTNSSTAGLILNLSPRGNTACFLHTSNPICALISSPPRHLAFVAVRSATSPQAKYQHLLGDARFVRCSCHWIHPPPFLPPDHTFIRQGTMLTMSRTLYNALYEASCKGRTSRSCSPPHTHTRT